MQVLLITILTLTLTECQLFPHSDLRKLVIVNDHSLRKLLVKWASTSASLGDGLDDDALEAMHARLANQPALALAVYGAIHPAIR